MKIKIPYKPTPKQLELHEDQTRFKVAVWGRRSGKSTFALNEAIKLCCTKPGAKVWIVTPTFGQGKDIYWRGADMLNKYLLPEMYNKKNDSDLLIEFKNGSVLQFKGADRPELLRGSGLDLLVLDEVAEFRYGEDTWESVLLPALSDKQGKAVFIGTPRGQDFFYKLFLRGQEDSLWRSWKIKTEESLNPWTLTIEGKEELIRLKAEMSPQLYAQEYECDFTVPVQGAYYGLQLMKAEDEGRITNVMYKQTTLVSTAWDIGVSDPCCIWFYQLVGMEIHLIDYFESASTELLEIAKMLQNKPYIYARHLMPHDGDSRDRGAGRSYADLARDVGIKPITIVPRISNVDIAGIESVRLIFNRMYFDRDKCSEGITALKNYRREYDKARNVYKNVPLHDWASHGSDALRTLAQGLKEEYTKKADGYSTRIIPVNSVTGF